MLKEHYEGKTWREWLLENTEKGIPIIKTNREKQ